MNSFFGPVVDFFKAHPKLRVTFAITLAAILIQNFPWLISTWLPKELCSMIQTTAYVVIQGSVLAVLVWAKQYNATGSGTGGAVGGDVTGVPSPPDPSSSSSSSSSSTK